MSERAGARWAVASAPAVPESMRRGGAAVAEEAHQAGAHGILQVGDQPIVVARRQGAPAR